MTVFFRLIPVHKAESEDIVRNLRITWHNSGVSYGDGITITLAQEYEEANPEARLGIVEQMIKGLDETELKFLAEVEIASSACKETLIIRSNDPSDLAVQWENLSIYPNFRHFGAWFSAITRLTDSNQNESSPPPFSLELGREPDESNPLAIQYDDTCALRILHLGAVAGSHRNGVGSVLSLALSTARFCGTVRYEFRAPTAPKAQWDRLEEMGRTPHVLILEQATAGAKITDVDTESMDNSVQADADTEIDLDGLFCGDKAPALVVIVGSDSPTSCSVEQAVLSATLRLNSGAHQVVTGIGDISQLTNFIESLVLGNSSAHAVRMASLPQPDRVASVELDISLIKSNKTRAVMGFGASDVIPFSHPPMAVPLESSPIIARDRQKLFGFRNSFLPTVSAYVGDGAVLKASEWLQTEPTPIALTGHRGIGKTSHTHRLAFFLTSCGEVAASFYFDLRNTPFRAEEMREMVGGVLATDGSTTDAVAPLLNGGRFLFVFDDLLDILPTVEDHPDARSTDILKYLAELQTQGHLVVLTGQEMPSSHSLSLREIVIPALNADQSRSYLAQIAAAGVSDDLIDYAAGNPQFLREASAHLNRTQPDDQKSWDHFAPSPSSPDWYDAYLSRRWRSFDLPLQRIIASCSNDEALLMEMLMVGSDRACPPDGSPFLAEIGADINMATAVEILAPGFLQKLPHGHIVNPSCLSYLRNRHQELVTSGDLTPEMRTAFAKDVCAGLGALAARLTAEPNPVLTHVVLANRSSWAQQLECLWQAESYELFLATIGPFAGLMNKAELGTEISNWALEFLNQHPAAEGPDLSPETAAGLVRVELAILAQPAVNAPSDPALRKIVDATRDWILGLSAKVDTDHQTIKRAVRAYCLAENFYIRSGETAQGVILSSRLAAIAKEAQAWFLFADTLKWKARLLGAAGEEAEAIEAEEQLLDTIPFNEAPKGFELRQVFDILRARHERADWNAVLNLAARVRMLDGYDSVAPTVDWICADASFQNEDYSNAASFYGAMVAKQQHARGDEIAAVIRSRIDELRVHLDAEIFNEVFGSTFDLKTNAEL